MVWRTLWFECEVNRVIICGMHGGKGPRRDRRTVKSVKRIWEVPARTIADDLSADSAVLMPGTVLSATGWKTRRPRELSECIYDPGVNHSRRASGWKGERPAASLRATWPHRSCRHHSGSPASFTDRQQARGHEVSRDSWARSRRPARQPALLRTYIPFYLDSYLTDCILQPMTMIIRFFFNFQNIHNRDQDSW